MGHFSGAGSSAKADRRRMLRIDGRKALPVDDAERGRATDLVERHASGSERPEFFEGLDVARRIAGNGRLGVERYVVLVRGKGAPDGHYLIDVKQALPSALASALRLPQPDWAHDAQRVVSLAQRCQGVPPAFLHAVQRGKRSYVLRDLQPTADRVAFDEGKPSAERLHSLMQSLGRCTAWAHLRAGGRQGLANADELIAFGHDERWPRRLRAASRECLRPVQAEWETGAEAYDDGAFVAS